jgi:two-component system phosphate regulon response regulator PhoB
MGFKKLLIIEDETAIREMVKFALSPAGFSVAEAANITEAKQYLARALPSLILLDWMLPGISGVEFAKKLKRDALTKNIPIIMLTARAEEENKVKALETGADDYITKPFSPMELTARIKAVLRRGPLISPDDIISVHGLSLDVNTQNLSIQGQIVPLSPLEYKLLHFFMTHQDRTYSRAQLLDLVWGRDYAIDERTVDVHIRRLRNRLKDYGCDHVLKTVRGTGYQLTGEKHHNESQYL